MGSGRGSMNFIEAVKKLKDCTAKAITRLPYNKIRGYEVFLTYDVPLVDRFLVVRENGKPLRLECVLADDWEVLEEKSTVTEEYVEAYFTKQQENMEWKSVGDTGAAIRSYQCGGMFDLLRGMGYSNKEIAEMVSGWNSEEKYEE
jgi:hypothetical protein